MLLLVSVPSNAESNVNGPTNEQKVIAGIIYKLIKFTHWPSQTADKPIFNLCLEQPELVFMSFEKHQVLGHKIVIKFIKPTSPHIDQCDSIYFNSGDKSSASQILTVLNTRPVLTISVLDDFHNQGGAIHLGKKNNRITFDVNLNTLRQHQLDIPANVLTLANDVVFK